MTNSIETIKNPDSPTIRFLWWCNIITAGVGSLMMLICLLTTDSSSFFNNSPILSPTIWLKMSASILGISLIFFLVGSFIDKCITNEKLGEAKTFSHKKEGKS